jgi:hypothetical protein
VRRTILPADSYGDTHENSLQLGPVFWEVVKMMSCSGVMLVRAVAGAEVRAEMRAEVNQSGAEVRAEVNQSRVE